MNGERLPLGTMARRVTSPMLKASYEFDNGRARIIHRGVSFWNGTEDEVSAENPKRTFDSLIYELLGAEEVWSDQYELKGIKITVEIGESRIQ